MSFNEQRFRRLVDETEKTVIALGTTAQVVLNRHKRFTEQLVCFLRERNCEFDLQLCLDYVNSIDHDPASKLSSSYVEWIAFHRFVHLIDEQRNGTLTTWKHYFTNKPDLPISVCFNEVLLSYELYQVSTMGLAKSTAKSRCSRVRKMLLYFEANGKYSFAEVDHSDVSGYLITERFKDRKPRGIQSELYTLRGFLIYAEENGFIDNKNLHAAIIIHKINTVRIITTLTYQQEKDILEDEPDSLVNKRDIAIALLALHSGLRTCDIRSLKFSDINWEKQCLSLTQRKTGVPLEIPIDAETENAIIDYVLNERRNCDSDIIFITGVGPTQELKRRHYRIRYRAKGSVSENTIPHDGLHIFRRTFASRLLNAGVELPIISEMLGQISKNTVQCYLSTDETKMKRCSLSLSMIPYEGGAYNV
ncbi:MAG: tyrosine-type recombinase/integrase [Lachnospiraceae bacterium]|nr:tyrosine-type recombinase/integrase [Lachnospiraceae bacterium]